MKKETAIQLWTDIQDNEAETLNGGWGRRGYSYKTTKAPRSMSKTTNGSAAPAAAPAASTPRPLTNLFESVYTPNPAGGPSTVTTRALPTETGVTRIGGQVVSGTVITGS
jgi:hypothetical protein